MESVYRYHLSVLQNCDGSSYFKINNSAALIGFYGPVEAKQSKEILDRANIDVLFKAKIGLATKKHKFYQSFVQGICSKSIILSKHPRTQLYIIIQEVIDSSGMLSCIINGACLALLDGGIEMNYTFAAVNCFVDSEQQIIINPEKDIAAIADITFVFENTNLKVVAMHQVGTISFELLTNCRKAARKVAKKLFNIQRILFKS